MADYQVSYEDFNALLESLPDNTPQTPYSIELTQLTWLNIYNQSEGRLNVGYYLRKNPTKYVQLSISESAEMYGQDDDIYGHSFLGGFLNCTSLVGIDLAAFSGKIEFGEAFYGCSNLREIDLSPTIHSTSFSRTFEDCTSLVRVTGIHGGESTKPANWNRSFSNCTSLKSAVIGNFELNNISGVYEMFSGCTSLTEVIGLEYLNFHSTVSCSRMFENCTSLTYMDISRCTGEIEGMFSGCTSLKEVVMPRYSSDWTHITDIFKGCTSLQSVDMSTVPFYQGDGAFEGCSTLKTVTGLHQIVRGISGDVSGSRMFKDCSSLRSVDISGVTEVSNADEMFSGCSSLETLSMASLTKLTEAKGMFKNCSSLTRIFGWSVPSVDIDVAEIFSGCTNLKAVYLSASAPLDMQEWSLFHVKTSASGDSADIDIYSDGGEKTTVTGVSLADGAYGIEFPVAVDDLYVGDGTDLSAKIREYLSERYPWSTRWQTDALDASKKNFVLWSRDTRSVRTNIFESGAVKVKGAVWND
ncbi:MAG: leucine-rich repeat protein [Treponema sp.]|nr:leucine-rich repeat protein [Treponema sp.]